jgi:hypothetical protein
MENDAMNITHDIQILQLAPELPPQLREFLIQKGLPTYISQDLGAVTASLSAFPNPILLVCCGDNIDFAFECTKRLIGQKDIHRFPLALVGKDVDSYENILNKHFVLATTISTPCANSDILEAIQYIVRTYPKQKGSIEGTAIEEIAPLPPIKPTLSEALKISEAPPILAHSGYKEYEGIPELFFAEIEKLKIGKDGIGGLLYPRGLSELFLKSGDFLPTEPKFDEAVRTVTMDAGKWGRLHLYRVSYICSKLATAINLPTEILSQLKTSIFLFPYSFIGENSDLLKREYHEAKYSAFRRELCSRVKDSAMHAALTLQAPEVGNLLATLGRLIGREEAANDSNLSIAASLLMAGDLADRVCFQSGHWNPRRAYMLLKKIRSEQLTDVHPRVLCALVKFLSEAVTSHPFAFVVPRHLRNDPKLQRAAKEWSDQKVQPFEKKVPLVSLMPGMRLSRPVITYDGREILSGDLTLDQDLIWRLWQLSSVRPVNGPLVVFSEN